MKMRGIVIFISAAMDNYSRAFKLRTGKLLWQARLPAGGQATPMTYRLRPNGKQYVVIAARGHALFKALIIVSSNRQGPSHLPTYPIYRKQLGRCAQYSIRALFAFFHLLIQIN